jgi:hypothetical protein
MIGCIPCILRFVSLIFPLLNNPCSEYDEQVKNCISEGRRLDTQDKESYDTVNVIF